MQIRTPTDLGSAIRDKRRRLNLDQDELAGRIGASRKWIIDVEKGKPRAEIGLVLRALDALGVHLSLDDGDQAAAADAAVPAVPAADIDRVLDRMRDKPP